MTWRPATSIRKPVSAFFTGIFALLALIPVVIVYIKRFHDRDKSGWWVLIWLIPIIGAIWLLIELGFLKGNPGAKPVRFAGDRLSEARRTPMALLVANKCSGEARG